MFMRHDRPAIVLDPAAPAAATVARRARARLRSPTPQRPRRRSAGCSTATPTWSRQRSPQAPRPTPRPGTLLRLDESGARIATSDGDLIVSTITTPEGTPVDLTEVAVRHGLDVGATIAGPPAALIDRLADRERAMSRDELYWIDRRCPSSRPRRPPSRPPARGRMAHVARPDGASDAAVLAAVAVLLARTSGATTVAVDLTDSAPARRSPRRPR